MIKVSKCPDNQERLSVESVPSVQQTTKAFTTDRKFVWPQY